MANCDLCIELAQREESHWEQFDFATKAALSILQDCLDRRGIKHEFDSCDEDVIAEIVDSWAAIIWRLSDAQDTK